MLDVHRLTVLRAVVVAGSVQSAATSLGYTPSAVSQHIAALQRETGLDLFVRVGRGIQPTSAGLRLAAEAEGVLERLGQAEQVVERLRSQHQASLSISYFASAGTVWLPPVLVLLGRTHGDVEISLSQADELPERVEDAADIQLSVGHKGFSARPGFTAVHLLTESFVAIVPAAHPLARKPSVRLAELAPEGWIDNDFARGVCRRMLIAACADAGFTPRFRVEADDHRIALACVAGGQGITVLPELAAVDLPDGTARLAVFDPTPQRSIFAIVRNEVMHSPVVTAALAELTRVAGAVGALDRRDLSPLGV